MFPPSGTLWTRHISLPRPRGHHVLAASGFTLLLAGLFPGLFRGEVFFGRDIGVVWLQQVEAFVRAVLAGGVPGWDPTVAFGRPLLANPNVQAFYPFSWLNLILPPWRVYTLYVIAHLALAGAGQALLARRLALSRPAALLSAAAWMASGPLLSFVDVWHHFGGSAWMPWVILLADRVLAEGKARSLAALGVAIALQVFVGSPDLCVLTGVVAIVYSLWRVGWPELGRLAGVRRLARVALGYALGLALAAVQLLPSLHVAAGTTRSSLGAESRTIWSLHPLALPQLLLPLSFSELPRFAPESTGPLFDLWSPFVESAYLGLSGALLAAWGVLSRRRGGGLALSLLVASVLVSLGRYTPVYEIVSALAFPLRAIRYPAKVMIVGAFAWSLLIGMGLDGWREGSLGAVARRRLLALFVTLGLLATGAVIALRTANPLAAAAGVPWSALLADNAGRLTVAALAAVAGAVVLFVVRPDRGWWPMAALAALLSADLAVGSRGLNPMAPSILLRTPPATLRFMDQSPPSRIYVWDYILRVPGRGHPVQGMLSLFMDVPGEPVDVARTWALQTYLYPPYGGRYGLRGSFDRDLLGLYPLWLDDLNLLLRAAEDTPAYARLLRLGGVDRVVALHAEGQEDLQRVGEVPGVLRRPILVFAVPQPQSRTYVVGRARTASGTEALRAIVHSEFDPAAEVVLEEALPFAQAAGPVVGESRITEDRPHRVTLEADLSAAGFLVLLDGADPGWRALVDGAEARVLRANVAFRAVALPPGRHRVEFVYRPPGLFAGLALTAVAALICGALVAAAGWRSPKAPASAGS